MLPAWRLILATDERGREIEGEKLDLIAAVKTGAEVRVKMAKIVMNEHDHLTSLQNIGIVGNTEVCGQVLLQVNRLDYDSFTVHASSF